MLYNPIRADQFSGPVMEGPGTQDQVAVLHGCAVVDTSDVVYAISNRPRYASVFNHPFEGNVKSY